MKINKIQFNNPYLEKIQVTKQKLPEQNSTKAINSSEVKFFQNLFPASAKQIENYLSLNQNGNIDKSNLNKGKILDAKI